MELKSQVLTFRDVQMEFPAKDVDAGWNILYSDNSRENPAASENVYSTPG